MEQLEALVRLANRLGDPTSDLAILAEGNVSARVDDETFLVKASGHQMGNLGTEGFVQVRFDAILAAFDWSGVNDAEVRECLAASRVHGNALPSVETFMHADLLRLPGVDVVGHTHPSPLLSLLCLKECEDFACQRLFPDEIVLCGPASAFVPYVDPGLPLAKAIRDSVRGYIEARGEIPKTIWLQNHGVIVLGKSTLEVESITRMAVKAARVWLGALSTGRQITPLSEEQISRIHTRPDEHHRQRLLWQTRQN